MVDFPISYSWRHLTDLPPDWGKLAEPQLATVADLWRPRLEELRGSTALQNFNASLARRWSIETGVIEGIYHIDRGITELLIERGIEAALIRHGTTDRPADDIVRILRDHAEALEGLFAFVSGNRELSVSYIRELHQQLCASQDHVVGVGPDGRRISKRLRKGDWKQWPNNPHRPDGSVHQYCPPEHVASEMEELVRLHLKHVDIGVPPEVEAAWLHHRFTQIHPFEDGNGRVARSLASLVLLREGLFPFIVERQDQAKYIEALEMADKKGDLGPLVQMIANQQQGALLAALDLSRDVIREQETAHTLESTLQDAARKLRSKHYKKQQDDFQEIQERAGRLITVARESLAGVARQMMENLGELASEYAIEPQESYPDQSHWFRYQVIQVARELRYFANTYSWHKWIRLRINGEHGGQIVFSFHQSGQDFRGVFMVSAFFELRSPDDSDEGKVFKPVVDGCFAITIQEPEAQQTHRFREWVNKAVAKGVSEWSAMI